MRQNSSTSYNQVREIRRGSSYSNNHRTINNQQNQGSYNRNIQTKPQISNRPVVKPTYRSTISTPQNQGQRVQPSSPNQSKPVVNDNSKPAVRPTRSNTDRSSSRNNKPSSSERNSSSRARSEIKGIR